MNENKSESVSSMLDGFQVSKGDVDDLLIEDEQQEKWQNYHLIGDVLRNDIPDELNFDISEKVALALADEPTILAPMKPSGLTAVIKDNVIKFAKPLGQMAIAASAAGLMIMGIQHNGTNDDVIVPNQVVQTNPLVGVAAPVSFNYTTPEENQENQKQAIVDQHRRFQGLLSDHYQQVKLNTVTQASVKKIPATQATAESLDKPEKIEVNNQ